MTTVPLAQTATVQLDSSGNGAASVGPLSAREVWHPANVHVSVSTATNEAQCTIYVGDDTSSRNLRDGTFTGSSGNSTDTVSADVVRVGHKVSAVWAGGDALAVATLTVTGSKDI
jgi:hypothetical protein